MAQLAEVERAARDYLGEDVDAIGRDELIARLRKGDVVLVDVRPAEEYEAGHIEGARSIPLDELEAGSPSCRPTARSWPTAAGLSAPTPTRRSGGSAPKGRSARRLSDGWPGGRLAGGPTEPRAA